MGALLEKKGPATLEFLDHACIGAVEDFAHLGLDRSAGALAAK